MAAVSVRLASKPKTATPRAKRKASRRRSRPSCTSTINSSSRFSPIVNSRRARSFEVPASCFKLTVAVSILGSVTVAGTPARDEIAENRPDADADGDGLIGMLMHGLVHRLGALDRFVADASGHFLGFFQRGGETLAGFADFFSCHVCGGAHKGAR